MRALFNNNGLSETIFTAVKLRVNQNAKDCVGRQEIKNNDKYNTASHIVSNVVLR